MLVEKLRKFVRILVFEKLQQEQTCIAISKVVPKSLIKSTRKEYQGKKGAFGGIPVGLLEFARLG